MNDDNKNILVGALTVTFILWAVFYGIPSLLFSLFDTLLGNLFLLLCLILLAIYNPLYAVLATIVVFLLIRVVKVGQKEGFTWTTKSINDFINIEDTVNQNRFYDIGFVQKHTSQEELDYFLKYGIWPWSTQTIQMYKDAINRNPYVQNYSGDSIREARKTYPEFSILQVLALQTREGDFLTNGIVINDMNNFDRDGRGSYPYNSNQIYLQNRKGAKQIKCSAETGRPIMIDDQKNITDLANDDLPNVVPGFQFLNGSCNVCDNLSGDLDKNYRCAFTFFNKPSSSVWNWFWSQDK